LELLELLLLGLAVGVVARLAVHGRGRMGVAPGLAVAVVGTVTGGLVARALGVDGGPRWVVAVAAAVGLLIATAAVRQLRSHRTD
jgi:uncharacterized membrane protein YeaQ/YmgE (transglycosylase-associated protein family)